MSKLKLNWVDTAILIYIIITSLYMLLGLNILDDLWFHFAVRVVFVLLILLLARFENSNINLFHFLKSFYPLVIIGYFYNETDYYNNLLFKNIDSYLIHIEHSVFGFQPSITFSQSIPLAWFSELMHFGYFSYYLMAIGILILFYSQKPNEFQEVMFIIITSFLIYYIVFAIIPSIGPQFYLTVEEQNVPEGYFFYDIMRIIITNFESKTGAFPSSHVGMAVFYLLILKNSYTKYFYFLIPFVIILILSTVYLKAHYAIDVIAGIITAPVMYYTSKRIFKSLNNCNPVQYVK